MTARAEAERLDASDPLAAFVDRFVVDDPHLCYLDGNSLGRLPVATRDRLRAVIEDEWGAGLVRSWDHWLELPVTVGDRLGAALLGAAPGQTLVADSVTVNLYKLTAAALAADPSRRVVVVPDDEFPTDRYVVDGAARAAGGWRASSPLIRSRASTSIGSLAPWGRTPRWWCSRSCRSGRPRWPTWRRSPSSSTGPARSCSGTSATRSARCRSTSTGWGRTSPSGAPTST